jgi:uncharacterized protein with GYD domain
LDGGLRLKQWIKVLRENTFNKKGGVTMATFLMFGKYSPAALKGISGKRTEEAVSLVKKFNGEVKSMYALLGEEDLVFTLTFPGIEEAMKASVALSKLTRISFTTSPAVTVEDFDKMMTDM